MQTPVSLCIKLFISKNIIELRRYKRVRFDIIKRTDFLPTNSLIKQRLWHIIHQTPISPVCSECKQIRTTWNANVNSYRQFCSLSCSNKSSDTRNKVKITNVQKYGCENPGQSQFIRTKVEVTNLEKFGVKNPFQSEEIKQKIQEKMLEKYGVVSPIFVPHLKEKQQQTCLERYGSHTPFGSKEIQQKIRQTNIERYGQHPKQLDIATQLSYLNDYDWLYEQHITQQKSLLQISKELDVSDLTIKKYLTSHNISHQMYFSSSAELEIQDWLKQQDIKYCANTRTVISPYELDIFIPEYNLAIEYCGLYWHTDVQGKDRNYHKRKLDLCKKSGVRLITLFEDEWIHKKELVKQKLLSLLNKDTRKRIFARKCQIILINNKTKTQFFESTHIQGNGPGSINIGLEYEGELVACMSFIKQQNGIYYLNRYATSEQVIGGFSKLLDYFKKYYQWNQIISFADLRWSQGNLYERTGFVLDSILPPDYEYVDLKNIQRIHKFNFRHKNLPNILGELYDPNLSESQNTVRAGWYKIYNCGLLRYILNN